MEGSHETGGRGLAEALGAKVVGLGCRAERGFGK